MYNRYIPQPDGSHRRHTMPQSQPQHHQQPVQTPNPQPQPQHATPPVLKAGDFLRRLIPKDLDTGDLLVIILLLLMSGDCQEEKNSALLTLALYFFM